MHFYRVVPFPTDRLHRAWVRISAILVSACDSIVYGCYIFTGGNLTIFEVEARVARCPLRLSTFIVIGGIPNPILIFIRTLKAGNTWPKPL